MANKDELKKLNRDQLNDLGRKVGVSDVDNEEKYATKADVADVLSAKVSDEQLQAFKSGEDVTPQDAPTAPEIDSPEDVDDQSGTEPAPTQAELEEEDDDDSSDPDPAPTRRGAPQDDGEEGMGFKRVKGKTVDIFDGKTPHTHVRNVSGVIVPLTEKNYNEKTDHEIIEKLQKLGKL